MLPSGMIESEPTLKNGHERVSLDMGICSFWKAARLMRLKTTPLSIRTWYNMTLVMVGEPTSGSYLAPTIFLGAVRGVEPDRQLHPLVMGRHSRRGRSCCHRSTQYLDDAPGLDVLGAVVHDVELLAALIGAGVRVAIDSLEHPLGILELHLLLLVALEGSLLLAFPQRG
jgi:hypothetical protein